MEKLYINVKTIDLQVDDEIEDWGVIEALYPYNEKREIKLVGSSSYHYIFNNALVPVFRKPKPVVNVRTVSYGHQILIDGKWVMSVRQDFGELAELFAAKIRAALQ